MVILIEFNTVKQVFSADKFFPRLSDFAVPRILIFADAGTEHSSFIVSLLECLLRDFIFHELTNFMKLYVLY